MVITNKILFFEEFRLLPDDKTKYYWLIDNKKRIEDSGLDIKVDRLIAEYESKVYR